MGDLVLPLKGIYFDQIRAGTKVLEYRLRTPYWRRRLARAPFDRLVLTKGYPRAGDDDRRLVLPWLGFVQTTIQHEHFGPAPVQVFAIHVGPGHANQG